MLPIHSKVRIARPTRDLKAVTRMYMDGLGFLQIGSFEDHDGFSGVMLGHPQHCYHLEFTEKPGDDSLVAPHPDQLIVFYIPDRRDWEESCSDMLKAGFDEVPAHNPYWDDNGKTYADIDGYRLVLQNLDWSE